ncbi:hypothetical protein TrVE_jg4581 [Triparma verrucosa]|uniref:S-adenosyl-L-methionine-dependent methyltransferase n=1 Tax=Triparma verrucosa TaxID=1606542 RepID=A0A9W7F8U1_9STRA|nr:hypothetical protein TrVE_jg4581 [Triparma verrucosa]
MNFFTCCVLLLFVSCRALTVPSLPSIPLPAPLCWVRSPASNSLGISSTSDPNQFISITFTPPPSVASHNLIKACCPKRLARSEVKVLDCTLGLGSDAHLLLSAGCEVLGCERDPRVHALVANAFERLGEGEGRDRISVLLVSAEDRIKEMLEGGEGQGVNTVYIDTMFPKRKKNRPPAKKEMELLRTLLETEDKTDDSCDCAELFELAKELAGRGEGGGRVVVKRPKGSEELGGKRTFVVGAGGPIRFDVYEC